MDTDPATRRLVCVPETTAALRRLGGRRARVVVLSGAQGNGKSTVGTVVSDGRIVFPSGNTFDHTTTGIDVGIVEEADGTVTIVLDCEGLFKNASKLDLAQLSLVAALLDARHIHCALGSLQRPVLDLLKTLAEFVDQHRDGEKVQLRVAIRTRRVGPQDPAMLAELQGQFRDTEVVLLPEVLQGDPTADPGLRDASASLKQWARDGPTPYTCAELADLFSVLVTRSGEPTDVPSLCDHLVLGRLRQHAASVAAPHIAGFSDSMPAAGLPAALQAMRSAIDGGAAVALQGRLSAGGAATWVAEVDAMISAQRTTWSNLLELYRQKQARLAAEAEAARAALAAQQAERDRQAAVAAAAEAERQRKVAQDRLDLIAQRDAYNARREATKAVSHYHHTQGWVHGGRTWYGKNGRGHFGCCGRKEGEGGCTAVWVHTLPEWNDGMFVANS